MPQGVASCISQLDITKDINDTRKRRSCVYSYCSNINPVRNTNVVRCTEKHYMINGFADTNIDIAKCEQCFIWASVLRDMGVFSVYGD